MAISFKIDDGRIFHFYTRNRKSYERKSWIQFYKGWDGIRFTFGPASYFDNRWNLSICLGWGKLYIDLPIYSKYDECDPPRYGFYYFERAFWICLGKKVKKISMPYDREWVRTSCLLKDGSWEHETKGNNKDFYEEKWKGIIWSETYPYSYTLRSGKVQQRTATLRVEEREWRQKWLLWTSLFSQRQRTISVDFSDEVGEKTGSWKGGCTGCGYSMRDGELPEQTLRRMEKERKF